ncbi:MAG: DNA repair protein RecO [Pseudopedobacter saltans]|uniref:DNA repair protein RecO n=1 Tax=Pseudopedobacter saltans TaxID=151895 RepID=A0A2W5ECG4_9SPHI|nr:MAG: DNA repair protein RecO [Pseudopedobacter saltans]
MLHKTKGIVLSTLKYGETSIITHIYTELFGMQHYLVKGVRKESKRRSAQIQYFQPGAILDLEVYQNSLKELQYIKEYQWHSVYANMYSEVIRHTIATYCAELADKLIKEPEADPDFFEEMESVFLLLDRLPSVEVSNIPVYFTLKILGKIGFSLSGKYDVTNFNVLDFEKGCFSSQVPLHPLYLKGTHAKFVHDILYCEDWTNISFNGDGRTYISRSLQNYLKIHIENFKTLNSLTVLETIFC